MRPKEEEKSTDNRTVWNRLRRRFLNCPRCPPHRNENAIRQFLEGQEPEYVWACKEHGIPTVDLEDVTCNILDNMWDDADTSDLNGVVELEAALDAFNKANESIVLWEVDYSTAVILPKLSG